MLLLQRAVPASSSPTPLPQSCGNFWTEPLGRRAVSRSTILLAELSESDNYFNSVKFVVQITLHSIPAGRQALRHEGMELGLEGLFAAVQLARLGDEPGDGVLPLYLLCGALALGFILDRHDGVHTLPVRRAALLGGFRDGVPRKARRAGI